jgi:hypothetical protein
MTSMLAQPHTPPAHAEMFRLLTGMFIGGAVATLAQLGVPDLLDDGPQSAEELATQIRANPDALYRLMRATASVGVLRESPDRKFSQTPMSAVLRTNANPSLRAFATQHALEWHALGWANLEYCVRTGKQALDKVYGMPIFKYFEQNPEMSELFNRSMSDLSSIDGPAVADAYAFDGIHSIVDVGGGHGSLLATVLARHPQMKGTLYEVAHVLAGAKSGPLNAFLDRCAFCSGDMFSSVPGGADAYIMKHIIHDWPDEVCVRILQACRKGVNAGGKLLVVDNVIPPGNDFVPGKFLDLQMLIFPGGRERTEKEFRELLAASGWRLVRVIPTAAPESVVEGAPA